MKLTSIFGNRKTLTVAFFMIIATFSYGRVFWNKFEVTNNNGTVLLTWNVTEYNNKSFVVQHSLNGIDWEDIAVIKSKMSAESMTDYSYKHSNKLNGKQYYRLKDIDIDLTSTGNSPVKTLILENKKQDAAIWPNPVVDHVIISNDDVTVYTTAKIVDLTGKLMKEIKLDPKVTEIPVNNLPTGIYIVRMENASGDSFTKKIVKQ